MGKWHKSFWDSSVTVKTGKHASKGKSGRNKIDVYSGTKGSDKHDHYWIDSKGRPGAKLRSTGRLEKGSGK